MGNGTSIGRVRGLGAAKEGTHHWLLQRFTAVGNLLLGIFIAVSFIAMPDMDYETMSEWIASPVQATAVALFVISSFWHARLGLQVLVEDYVHTAGNKFAAMTALNLFTFAGAAFGLFAIVRLALGGAA
ncbi:succinate dehydrogenase, hydrophobic membrane anchor protein [Alteraurantiacibacter aquimixticola]|uniref:Succinate dehydrogenase hydrophobic membrane anchor subunit n=1 Tax=Alteraurantiacibacter aquimixticola TaxID=2489173 RepID=A0A4T3F1T2_9SPHN|nr:succinate dehydrogenase, hydrophobic membrane anchor protein [Alteraurantiacibacter aquimixticola]TIX50245.1 succinate dehydrogenase, hydrophobic membrane anchor protein [Alteraurantiacibacter aquimixticola]